MGRTGYAAPVIRLTLTTAVGTSKELRLGDFSYGAVLIPAASTNLTTLTFWVSEDGVTYFEAYDGGTAETMTVAEERAYRLTSDLFVHKFLKIVGSHAEAIEVVLAY